MVGLTKRLVIEGEYSNWAYQWKQSCYSPEGSGNCLLRVDETLDKIFIQNSYFNYLTTRRLSDGLLETVTTTLNPCEDISSIIFSVLRKYFTYVVNEGGFPKAKIFKDGALIQTIDLSQPPISWTDTTASYYVSFSPNGKYFLINNTVAVEYALFKGI